MNRTRPAETKLVICVWHPFTWWRPQPVMAESIRRRWPEMRVLHLPNYDALPTELPDTDIFVGYSLRAPQLQAAKKLKSLHSTAAGVAPVLFPALGGFRNLGTGMGEGGGGEEGRNRWVPGHLKKKKKGDYGRRDT